MSKTEPPHPLHLVLERISSIFRAEGRDKAGVYGLKLVQLEALIYFSVANRYSDTAGALAEYLGITKGTASQSVLALERRNLIEKEPDAKDGRVLHCKVTAEGRQILEDSNKASFLSNLSEAQSETAHRAALQLMRTLQAGVAFQMFGQCKSCTYFQNAGAAHRCGLTGEALSKGDSMLICREHKSAA